MLIVELHVHDMGTCSRRLYVEYMYDFFGRRPSSLPGKLVLKLPRKLMWLPSIVLPTWQQHVYLLLWSMKVRIVSEGTKEARHTTILIQAAFSNLIPNQYPAIWTLPMHSDVAIGHGLG